MCGGMTLTEIAICIG